MMPKPNQNKRIDKREENNFKGMASEKVLLETRPNFWLYSDNFILKIVVLFILVFMFAPIMSFVYVFQRQLLNNFHIAIDNVMFYTELILIIITLLVIIKLILDILDWNYTTYVLTDTRIVIQRGFIHKEKIIMSYTKIQDIEIRQSLLERLINVGDIIIYGANEVSETILDDIPSPRKAEEIILTRMNSIGFANQNTYMNNNYQQQAYQQQAYNPQYQQQQAYNPQYQQQGYNLQLQQQPNYQQEQYYQQQTNNHQQYQEDPIYIQPEHNEHDNNYHDDYEDDVITPERHEYERKTSKTRQSSQKLDKKQILRKHDEMFKRHK